MRFAVVGWLVNMVRSFPFVILLVALVPFTRWLVGTSIGPMAASVPLACAVCSRSFRAENLLDWRLDGLPATPEQIGPRYAHALARLRRRTG